MKLKTFLIVGCLGGFSHSTPVQTPTNEKDYSVFVNPLSVPADTGIRFPEQ